MLDTGGEVTTNLLRGASYTKDNRLLPLGFDLEAAGSEIAVYGEAAQDADFAAGGDLLKLEIELGAAEGPFTVKVELLYQPIGYRWAMNLTDQPGAEIDQFAGFYARCPNISGPGGFRRSASFEIALLV